MMSLAAILVVGKWSALPTSAFLARHISISGLPPHLHHTVTNVLFVPLGALVVVVFRVTLGIRVLGPFRSILLAFAFLATGILWGLVFFAATVGVLVLARPLIKSLRMPYYGRISVMLSAVALLLAIATLVGVWVGSAPLRAAAGFPIVVLCLVGDAVARTIRAEGVRSGLWRAAMTALAGVVVAGIASISALRDLVVRYPELMLIETALILVVSKACAWRALGGLNPKPVRMPGATGRAADPSHRPIAMPPEPQPSAPSAAAGHETLPQLARGVTS
jgi:hypothetical protein